MFNNSIFVNSFIESIKNFIKEILSLIQKNEKIDNLID